MKQPKIDIMIVGAQKAGTSSLAQYLDVHPEVVTHEALEMTYFVREEEYQAGYEVAFDLYFPHHQPGRKVLAKSVGVMYLPQAIERLKEHNPHVQVVATLRDPVKRAYSAYWYARRTGYETLDTFEKALAAEAERLSAGGDVQHTAYLHRGYYAEQIENLYQHFERDQVHIIVLDDLKGRSEEVVAELLPKLGLSATVELKATETVHNASAAAKFEGVARFMAQGSPLKRAVRKLVPKKLRAKVRSTVKNLNEKEFTPPPIASETEQRLCAQLRPEVEKLEALLGRDLSGWK